MTRRWPARYGPCLRLLSLLTLLTGVVGAGWSAPLAAQDRLYRRYAAGQGLHAAPIAALEQDARGFLWIGGQDGLFRYDGTEFRRWAPSTIQGVVSAVATDERQRLVALTEAGNLYRITRDEAHPVEVPLPAGPGRPNAAGFDRRGWLWIVRGGRVAYRDGEVWRILPSGAFGGEEPRFLHPGPGGEMAVATRRGVWATDSGTVTAKLMDAYEPADFVFLPDGIAALDTIIREVRNGRITYHQPQLEIRSRPIALAVRGNTVWASYDRYLVALRSNRPPEILGPNHGVESGGPLLVDHEGSLWLGTFSALLQYPEPETRIWNERSGLRSQHTRFVGRSGKALWFTTWQGTGIIRNGERGPTTDWVEESFSQQDVCEDEDGGIWLAGRNEILHVVGERVVRTFPARFASTLRCGPDQNGGTWLAVSDSLFHTEPAGLRIVDAPPLPERAQPVLALLHDRKSRLWIGGDRIICSGEVTGRGRIGTWQCTELMNAGLILALAETASGNIWAASSTAGVLRNSALGWTEIEGNRMLPTRSLVNLIPSPAGGIWVLGHGVIWRVQESADANAMEVFERLGEWHGLPVETGRDLLEDPDETLWITTSLGLIEVPRQARESPDNPPPAELVYALVDGEVLDVDGGGIELPYHRNRLELRFAVLSFRDPSRVRYQVRLGSADAWQVATGRPWFRWIDLQAKSHRAELRASLDEDRWSRTPASLEFLVHPPWYRTRWAIALFALVAGVTLWLGYRARVRYLLGLERQRTRIAMDLHDEMGSGLGSIGILSGLLATRGAQDDSGRDLARRIVTTAEDLGHSLSNIIWSLDARPATLGKLASRLADAGMNMLASQGIDFRIVFPERWPSDQLSASERQDLLLIGLEALHNAARHSRATSVRLEIRGAGSDWEMLVSDDGVGFDPTLTDGGHGLDTMKRRAADIGASIEWRSSQGHGTEVALRFTLGSAGARRRLAGIRGWSAPHR